MPVISPTELNQRYDAVVIGSGAAGGQVAYTLAMEGARVLMLEAGRNYDPITETAMFQTNGEAPLRGASTPDKPLFFHDATVDGGWAVPGEPYTNASMDDPKRFDWWRSRMLGGRTNHWGRTAQRLGPFDFKPRKIDGLGVDWPLEYEELAPYYDKVEMLLGVYGTNEHLPNVPDSSPGVLLPAPKPRIGELFMRKHARRLGIGVFPIHRAVMTQKLDHVNLPAKLHPGNPKAQRILAEDMLGRAACFWATICPRGCAIRATYQSTTVHLPPAFATGNLDLITDAMVREVLLDAAGRATGVVFIDKKTGMEHRATGKAIVLAGGSYESVRLLLNSRPHGHADGIGNGSGHVGRHLLDTFGTSLRAQIPALENMPPHNEDGAGGQHCYIPWWLVAEQHAGKLDFPRAYQITFSTGRRMPSMGAAEGVEQLTEGSYGLRLKKEMRRFYGSIIVCEGQGETLPNDKRFCEIDPTVKDRWGIPVLRFHWAWSDEEVRRNIHIQGTLASLFNEMGGRLLDEPDFSGKKNHHPGGFHKHEVGGARMGTDPRSSVTNRFGQVWDVPNLFAADGSIFCTNSEKAPTLTILALAWRTADHILQRLREGELS